MGKPDLFWCAGCDSYYPKEQFNKYHVCRGCGSKLCNACALKDYYCTQECKNLDVLTRYATHRAEQKRRGR